LIAQIAKLITVLQIFLGGGIPFKSKTITNLHTQEAIKKIVNRKY
jgi:hypothetical protein